MGRIPGIGSPELYEVDGGGVLDDVGMYEIVGVGERVEMLDGEEVSATTVGVISGGGEAVPAIPMRRFSMLEMLDVLAGRRWWRGDDGGEGISSTSVEIIAGDAGSESIDESESSLLEEEEEDEDDEEHLFFLNKNSYFLYY